MTIEKARDWEGVHREIQTGRERDTGHRQRQREWERGGEGDEELMMMMLTVMMKTFSGSVCGWFHGIRRLILCRI